MMYKYIKDISLLILSSVLFYISFPNIFFLRGIPALSFVSMVPFLSVLARARPLTRTLCGALLGFVSYGLLLQWTFPDHKIGFFLLVFVLSLQTIIFSIFLPIDKKQCYFSPVVIASVWVVSEFIRNYILGGFSWTIGHSQGFSLYFNQIANLSGPYGISFFILFVNVCFYNIFVTRIKRIKNIIFLLVAFSAVLLYSMGSLLEEDTVFEGVDRYNVCTVQPSITPQEKSSVDSFDGNFSRQLNLTRKCFEGFKPNLVVWPETAFTDDIIRLEKYREAIERIAKESNVGILMGSALNIDSLNYNGAVYFDVDGKVKQVYKKIALIPFVEYLPWLYFLNSFKESLYNRDYVFSQGSEMKSFTYGNGRVRFSPVICSEEGYSKIIRAADQMLVQLLVVLLNDESLRNKEAFMMHAQLASLQAISFGLPIVRSSNSGLSAYIDNKGRIDSDFNSLRKETIFKFKVNAINRYTMYGKYGDVFVVICIMVIIFCRIKRCIVYRK